MDIQVDRDIRKARTLPAEAFIDPEILNLELLTVFSNSWLLAPPSLHRDAARDARELSERLEVRGARLPFSIMDRPLFFQRGWEDGALRCFPNVCTHAWYPLVSGPGRGRNLICGQHGRQFDCSGRMKRHSGFEGLPGFPGQEDHLASLPLESWGRFLFLCLNKPRSPLSRVLAELQASTVKLQLGSFKPQTQPEQAREVGGNWKQHAWNYMDQFHIAHIHKAPGGLADAVELPSYRTELYENSSLQWVYARNPEHGFKPEQLPKRFQDSSRPEKRVFALWWFVFPNMTFNFYPWGLSVNVYEPIPGRPERTNFLWSSYVLDEAKAKLKDTLWLSSQVDAEDVDALSQIPQGARSGFAPRGRFSPTEEQGSHWFHLKVCEGLKPKRS